MTADTAKARANRLAEDLLRFTEGMTEDEEPLAADNSRARSLDPKLRARFISFRAWMQRRGLVDPVLNRFDTFTVPQAATREIAERLKEIAASLPESP